MSFDDMPDLGPQMLPGASAYADEVLARSREAVQQVRVIWDRSYGADAFQKLDVYLPAAPQREALPVVVFLHGGAWRHGFKEWNGFMAPTLTSLPAVFVSANYRLAPAVRYPAPLEDVAAAVGWVRHHASEYGADPRRVFLAGHSAGGHLAALATLKRVCGDVSACFAISAPLDLRLDRCEANGRRAAVIRNFLARDEDDRDASPSEQTRGNATPFLLAWGERDLPEVREHNPRMAEALDREGCRVERLEVAGWNHFDMHRNCVNPGSPWLSAVRAWMR